MKELKVNSTTRMVLLSIYGLVLLLVMRSQGSLQEEDEPLTQVDQNDINDNSAILTGESSGPSYLPSQYESAANEEIIPPDVYRQMLGQLNNKQREFIMYHRNCYKSAVAASRMVRMLNLIECFLVVQVVLVNLMS